MPPGDAAVVDASVALKWFFRDEDHVDRATAMFAHFMSGKIDLLAPVCIRSEVPASIARGYSGPVTSTIA